MEHYVGLGEYVISNNPIDIVTTFALSTCVGIVAYFKENKTLGMVHIVLPESTGTERLTHMNEMRFANSAVTSFFNKLKSQYGCIIDKNMTVRIFGGVDSRQNDIFHVGERNLEAVRRELSCMNIAYDDSETGGYISRTIVAYVDTGIINVIKGPLIEFTDNNL